MVRSRPAFTRGFWLILLLCAPLAAQRGLPSIPGKDQEQQHLLQLKRDWGRSYVEHDREALEHILAAEYVLVDDNGKTSTRQQMIEDFLTSGTIYETATYDDTRVQIYDNFAIVSGRGVVKGKGKNGSFHRQYFQRMSSSNAMGDGRPSQLTFPASVTCPSSEEKLSCKSLGDGNEGRSGNE